MSLVGLLTRLLRPERVTGFDRQTVLLLHLGSNQPDPATGTFKRLSIPVAGSGWLEPKFNTLQVHGVTDTLNTGHVSVSVQALMLQCRR